LSSRSAMPPPNWRRCCLKTPAGVLLGIPGVSVITARNYGAAIGDPKRYRDAGAAYRASAWFRSVMNRLAVPGCIQGSAAKDQSNYAGPSSI
jgi:hypothetical protein